MLLGLICEHTLPVKMDAYTEMTSSTQLTKVLFNENSELP
jgi:hypothetical protein